MYHFCTIASHDYLPFVQTLLYSLKKNGPSAQLHALIVNDGPLPAIDGVKWYSLNNLMHEPSVHEVVLKYSSNGDAVRWALKPFFLSFLVEQHEKVIYLDNDLYFFNRYDFLFKELDNHTLLLSPHWSCFDPLPDFENFLTSFQVGLYNAGFVGATKAGKQTLQWWGKLCLHTMQHEPSKGLFDDQRYLDLAPIFDPEVGVLRHLGCNISSVNMHQNRRELKDQEVMINGIFPIVFIHFSGETVKHILNGNDSLLRRYFDEYKIAFAASGQSLSHFKHNIQPVSLPITVKRKIRLRTRIKQAVFKLWQKL